MGEDMAYLETLYQEHGPSLLAYLQRRCGSRQLAEDVLQETFVSAMQRPERVREARSPRAWLFVIARNLLATDFRRRRPTEVLTGDALIAPAPEDRDDLERMTRAIAGLSVKLREPLELRLQGELSYEQIAQVLEIPVGTVRSRLHHAVRSLREAMKE